MHSLQILLIQASTTTTTVAKSTKSSGSQYSLLIVVALFVVVYVFFLRPRTKRLRAQQATVRQLSVGDPVVTAGGICGTVVALDTEVVEVEVAPGTVITFLRRSVNPRPGAAPAPAVTEQSDSWDYPAAGDGPHDDGAAGDGPADPDEKSPT